MSGGKVQLILEMGSRVYWWKLNEGDGYVVWKDLMISVWLILVWPVLLC